MTTLTKQEAMNLRERINDYESFPPTYVKRLVDTIIALYEDLEAASWAYNAATQTRPEVQ